MSKKFTRNDALENISNWSTSDVLCLLKKNGLEECSKAITKRQVDGDELLHLTEGKLALWKSDLTRPLICSLGSFVEEVKKAPEKYVEEKLIESQVNEDHLSDTGSWSTDFEDDTNDESVALSETKKAMKSNDFGNRMKILREDGESKNTEMQTADISKQEDEGTYANCGSMEVDETTYANFQETKNPLSKNISKLHGLAEQLKEQLKLRDAKKPIIGPKPEPLASRKIEIMSSDRTQPQKSFLHNALKTKSCVSGQTQKRMMVPPPPEPKKPEDQPILIEKFNKDHPKPPITIRNLDLVANLPTRMEECEYEYEAFDEQIIEQNQKKNMSRVSSKQSLNSGHQSSVESIYQPPSITSHEEEDEQCELYESITETLEENVYLSPIQRTTNLEAPPLPAKPSQSSATPSPVLNRTRPEKTKGARLADEVSDMIVRIKRGLSTCCYSQPPEPPERSPEKKSATLPHSSSNTSLSTDRATRPLPPPPERQSFVDKHWFHNVTREQAANLIKKQSTYNNPPDGYFLLRPSTSNPNNPLALVLWYKDRVYNVQVRKRPDNRYALGFAKVDEPSFSSVEEMVIYYTREKLLLHTGGVLMGSTKLTETPPK